ncbi:uncharacterized protein METZ01_LOCUS182720, partial [marine metagenome]
MVSPLSFLFDSPLKTVSKIAPSVTLCTTLWAASQSPAVLYYRFFVTDRTLNFSTTLEWLPQQCHLIFTLLLPATELTCGMTREFSFAESTYKSNPRFLTFHHVRRLGNISITRLIKNLRPIYYFLKIAMLVEYFYVIYHNPPSI